MRPTTAAIALAFALATAASAASAEPRTQFVSWRPMGTVSVAIAVGSPTLIAFAPAEQITFASLDDGARWDAHPADPILSADNVPIPQLAVTATSYSDTTLTVRTTGREYHVRLRAVASAPARVAFTYARTIALDHRDPAPALPTPATAAPPAAASATAALPAPAPVMLAAVSTPTTRAPAPLTLELPAPYPTVAPATAPNPCPNQGKVSNTLRTVGAAAQVVDAAMVVKALKAHSFAHAVFGVHNLAYYLAELAAEDYVVHAVVKRACPNTQNAVAAVLAGAALYNAASIPAVTHP